MDPETEASGNVNNNYEVQSYSYNQIAEEKETSAFKQLASVHGFTKVRQTLLDLPGVSQVIGDKLEECKCPDDLVNLLKPSGLLKHLLPRFIESLNASSQFSVGNQSEEHADDSESSPGPTYQKSDVKCFKESCGECATQPPSLDHGKLRDAIWTKRYNVVDRMLTNGVDVNRVLDPRGRTLLMLAVSMKHPSLRILQRLVDCKADLTATDEDGWTALHYAAESGRQCIVDALLSSPINVTNKNRETAMDLAKKKGHYKIVRILQQATKKECKKSTRKDSSSSYPSSLDDSSDDNEDSQGCQEIVQEKPPSNENENMFSQENLRKFEMELKLTRTELTDVKRQMNRTLKKTDNIDREVRQLKSIVEDLQGTSSESYASGATLTLKPRASGDIDRQVRKLGEKYTQLNEIVTQLVADVEQHKGTLTQMHSTVDHISQPIPRFESILEELNLKIEILEVKSQTGNFVWKVNEVARRQREARIGRTVSLYSPPFYTSVHGYRICLRTYLNGDGSGRDSHISLFVVLMKSEYDDLLSWPFRHKVTLRLINLDYPLNPEHGISHKFIPNTDSSSFQKPVESFNMASGFPEFAPQSVLEDQKYVRNDTMYFQVITEAPVT